MKRKVLVSVLIVFLLILFGVPASFLYILENGNPYTRYLADKHIPEYLENQGYTKEDLKDAHYVEVNYRVNKKIYSGFYDVIFNDEKGVIYSYGITRKGKDVVQLCEKMGVHTPTVTKAIHSEEGCVKSLENRTERITLKFSGFYKLFQ
ncbi:DUF3139 domain-containing protein [Ureibacillus aquaedulcis]|uniref:DUF3139 domain-containing protein n=1 Tax=Ureibacillus aquaedulcis TaxID=3058421 RepID=A0ABT8GR88_9BACL|nr:DUF3139 domain-containing protein [Ureibacillus sp. BA0131]MDN4493933.1 DUF3139 domain-containing protein [Ureibacillus sp. BA0131]